MELKKVKLSDILPPKLAMRSEIEQAGINELASSIMEVGLINPITLQPKGKKYEIIAGFRRFQALTQLQFNEIDANIVHGAESVILQMRMDENLIRRDISDYDEAVYIEAIGKQLDLNQAELANKIGKSPSYVNERLKILSYPPELLKALKDGKIAFSVAREFSRCDDIKAIRIWLRYAEDGMNARVARKMVQTWEYDNKRRADANEPEPIEESEHERAAERAIQGACEICGKSVDTRTLRAVWTCPDCHHSIMTPSE
jgi:ParB family chromosome partitioning protein